MRLTPKEREIGLLFHIGVIVKGLDGLLELLGSLLALLIPPSAITSFVISLTHQELVEDPHDVVANFLRHTVEQYSVGASHFAALYLFIHGAIKIFLVVALLKNKLWAYPLSLFVLGLFVIYQVYQYVLTHSLIMLGLTVLDVIIIWLIWLEYKVQKRHHAETGELQA